MMSWQHFAPEQELLIRCASTDLSESSRERVRALAQHPLDTEYVLRHARRHGVCGLMRGHLQGLHENGLSGAELERFAQQITIRNLQYTKELVRVARILEREDIRVIPFKGPMLSNFAYGDAAYRAYQDIDILVPRNELHRTKSILLDNGFQPAFDLSAQQERERIEAQVGYEFVRREHGFMYVVELHWSFLNTCHNFELTPEGVFERAETLKLGGQEILSMAPEDLLIYLSAHGTKHVWERLTWIGDIAAVVRSRPDLDWSVTLERARNLGSVRMLSLGLYLAAELLELRLPGPVHAEVYGDSVVPKLADRVVKGWLFREPASASVSEWEMFWFILRTRENWFDNLPYLRHNARLALAPSDQDRDAVDLPQSMSALYYLVRPFRVIKQRLF